MQLEKKNHGLPRDGQTLSEPLFQPERMWWSHSLKNGLKMCQGMGQYKQLANHFVVRRTICQKKVTSQNCLPPKRQEVFPLKTVSSQNCVLQKHCQICVLAMPKWTMWTIHRTLIMWIFRWTSTVKDWIRVMFSGFSKFGRGGLFFLPPKVSFD